MAHSDKDIVITPNKGSTTNDPQIVFSGADASTGPQNITLKILPASSGTLSIEGSAGQLLAVTNSLTGVIFTVNDVSGIPSIEVNSSGLIKFAQYGGNVVIGGASEISSGKLSVYAGGSGGVSWGTGFNLGSAANYTSQIQDASVTRWRNFGASGYQWYNGAGTAARMTLSDSGNLTISGEITATRLVDADNSNFYVDPAGTSVLNIVNILGGTTRDTFGPERRYYLGALSASATQAREHEIARVYIDFNDWHAAGTIFVELQNYYYFGGDTQIWSISYDYNNVNCDLIWGNSPRGRMARVRAGAPTQANGLTGDFYYIPIYVDVRFYSTYYTYLRTSWPEVTAHANSISGGILVYTTPTPVNITDFTPPSSTFTNNNITTSGNMEAALFQEYGNTGRYVNPDGASVIGALTANGRLVVNNNTSAGGIYLDSANDAYITANRTATADGDVGFKFSTAAAVRWTNYLATNDNNTLRWLSATGTVLTLNQAGALVASDQVQAPIFYDKDDTAYYLDPAAGAPSSAPGKSAVLRGHILQQTLMSRPYVVWGVSGNSTGQVVIRLPGTVANYGMVHAVIDIYEYNGNNVATAIIGGHNWVTGQWYNFGCNLIGFTDKQIRLGVVGNQFCISIGSNGSVWNYGQVVLRKIQNGSYYAGVMDLGGSYSITLEPSIESSYTYISGDLRQLRSAGSFTTTGYIYGQRFVDYDNNAFYVDPASGSVLGGSITKDGKTVPWVAIQDTAPTATQAGDLWWESDVGRLKIWYNDGTSSQWVDATPVPDLSQYLSKAGGTLTGPLVSNSYIIAQGYIQSNTSLRSNRFTDQNGTFLFQSGVTSGNTRHINLADSTSDPSSVGSNTGITAGQRGDNNAYYMIYVKSPYSNGYSTHSRLVLGWHTGVEIGGSTSYGGTRFMSDSPGVSTSQLMSIGAGDSHVRVNNDLFAARFLDINDSAYFLNPATDRASNIYGFTAFTVEGTKGTYKYNVPRWAHTGDQSYWVGSMGWGNNSLDGVFDWGSGFADSWGSPGGAPGDTSHYVLAQAVHYTNGTNRYGWQLAGGVTDSFWWRKTWNGFSQWYKIAMYGNNASAGSALYASQFIDSNNTAFFADPASISNMYLIQGKLYTNTADYQGTENPAIKTWTGVLCAGSDYYGAEAFTYIKTKVRFDSYMMGGVTIDWFENYGSTNAKTQICLGGYWNPPGNGGMQGFEYTSTNPNIRPTIVVGYDADGDTCFRLSHYSSNYVQIVVRDLWLGYSGGNQNMGDSAWQGLSQGWILIQSSNANYNSFAGQVTVQPRLAVAMDSVSLMTAAIGRGSHLGGFLQGSYNSVGANGNRSNPIYTIGSSYNPSETVLNDMYGIGYTSTGFGSINHRSDWGMYVAADGDIRVWLDGSAGRVIGTGNFYGDYFYDYYDTNYYLNPPGNSQLRAVFADNWFRPQGNTGVYWQDYDRGLTTPENQGNSYGTVTVYNGRNGWAGYGIYSRWALMSQNGDAIGIHDNNVGWLYYWNGSRHYFYRGGIQSVGGSIYAPSLIDTNDESFYCDPNSTSVLARIRLPQNPVGTQYAGSSDEPTYYIGQTSGNDDGWKIYSESPSGSNTGALILQSEDDYDGNESIRLRFKRLYGARNTNDILIANFNQVSIFGSLFSDNWQVRTNTFYNIDNAGNTSLENIYANAWFRNRQSGQGMYNQSTGMHWYTNNGYWKAAGGGYTYGGIAVYRDYEGDLRGYTGYYDSSGFGLLNSAGNWRFRLDYGNGNSELYAITYANDFRPYIIYDRNNSSYQLDMDGTNILWRPDAATQQRWSAPWRAFNDNNVRSIITSDSNYWTTTMGWGTSYGTWATVWRYGFGGFDIWGSGTDHPQGGGYVHAQGIQSGIHYATSDAQAGYGAYGWQMVGAADAADRWWLRGKWWSTRSWFEIALYNNNSSSGDLYAGRFYDRNTNYYGDFDSQSIMNYVETRRLTFIGVGGNSGQGTEAYAIYQENGGWSYPYPDLRIAYHVGIKFGANPSYEGMRFYTDYDMSSLVFQVNGSSNYLFKYYWMYTNGATGFYSDLNGWEIQSNNGNSSYGSMTLRGNRSGWYGLFISTGNSPHLMFDGSGNGGCYSEGYGRWMWYHSLGNNCMGVGTSTTNGSYGLYVVKGIYSEGNVVAYSDRRAKENIYTIDNALEKVEKMRGVYFNYKTTPDKKDVGVIAQEMLEAVPEVVDYDKENDKYSVGYGNLTAVLIEAVKELSAEVKRLKKKLGEE